MLLYTCISPLDAIIYMHYHYKCYYILTSLLEISLYTSTGVTFHTFPHTLILREKLFWIDYSYLAVIKVLYQGPFTKIPSILPLTIFESFQFKCAEGHSPCGGPALRTKRDDRPHPRIFAPGATGLARSISHYPGVTECAEMFQTLMQNEYVTEFLVVMWVCLMTFIVVVGVDNSGRVWACVCTYVGVHVGACMCACGIVRVWASTFTCVHAYVSTCMRECVYVCVRVQAKYIILFKRV